MYLERKNRFTVICAMIGLCGLLGCSTLNPWVDRKSDLSIEKAKKIQINITTKESIIKEFGEPYVVGLKNGNDVLIFVGSRDGQNSTLEIKLNEKGFVKDYTFYEENPKKAAK